MNRILFDAHEASGVTRVVLRDDRARHLLRVLRVREGDRVRVGILDGAVGTARVTGTAGEAVELEPAWEGVPPVPCLSLLLAVPRPKVMRRLWAPLASMGVRHIVLTNAARVERHYFDTHWLAPETYRPRLVEGLCQSGDTHLPMVSIHRRLKPFLEDTLDTCCPDHCRLLAHPRDATRFRDLDREGVSEVLLAIGPEGGWTDFECDLLSQHGFRTVSMGSRTLRTDAACIALMALAREWLDLP